MVALAAYGLLALHLGAADGFHFYRPLRVGSFVASPEQLLPGLTPEATSGYDGQFYFYIAQDPFLTRPATSASLDNSFRYRRILYPLLAWLLSAGQRQLLPVLLLAINVVAGAALVGVLAAWAARHGRSSWWALTAAASAGVWIPIALDLTEPLQLLLLALGLTLESAGLLFAAALAKETAAVAMGTEMLRLVRERRWPGAAAQLGGLLVFAAWAVVVQLVVSGAHGRSATPDYFTGLGLVDAARQASSAAWILLAPALAILALALARLALVRDGPTLAATATALIALAAPITVWGSGDSYWRVIGAVPVLVFLSWCARGDRLGLYCTILAAASGVVIAAGLLAR